MVGNYDVRLLEVKAGTVQVTRSGLYYRFSCRCPLGREQMRLWMRIGNRETDLGLCVPIDGGFGTDKCLPAKQCPEGRPEFILRPPKSRARFVPLSPEEPFRYLHRLENAYLEQRGNTLGIVLPDDLFQ